MSKFAIAGSIALALSTASLVYAAEPPQLPEPQEQHKWLQKFVGEWDFEAEAMIAPDQPAVKAEGSETVRPLGGFWIVGQSDSKMMGMDFKSVLTLGFDAEKGKYVGTWVDSMTGHLWIYDGELDPTGKILTLESEGPCPLTPGVPVKFRDVTEFKSDDHRVFSSARLGEDGEWSTFLNGSYRRKK